MTPRDHEVYKMYLWKGLSPYEIDERIQPETNGDHRSGIEILKDLEAAMLYHNQKMPTPQPSNRMVSLNGIYASTLNIETNEISENPDWMNKALKNLSDEQQLVLKLRFWDDIPPKDIARVLNIKPPSKVYCILKKGLDQIRVYHNKFKLQQGL